MIFEYWLKFCNIDLLMTLIIELVQKQQNLILNLSNQKQIVLGLHYNVIKTIFL